MIRSYEVYRSLSPAPDTAYFLCQWLAAKTISKINKDGSLRKTHEVWSCKKTSILLSLPLESVLYFSTLEKKILSSLVHLPCPVSVSLSLSSFLHTQIHTCSLYNNFLWIQMCNWNILHKYLVQRLECHEVAIRCAASFQIAIGDNSQYPRGIPSSIENRSISPEEECDPTSPLMRLLSLKTYMQSLDDHPYRMLGEGKSYIFSLTAFDLPSCENNLLLPADPALLVSEIESHSGIL